MKSKNSVRLFLARSLCETGCKVLGIHFAFFVALLLLLLLTIIVIMLFSFAYLFLFSSYFATPLINAPAASSPVLNRQCSFNRYQWLPPINITAEATIS